MIVITHVIIQRMEYSVLVVEDDAGIRKYLKELLLENGYAVQTASNGLAALDLIEKTQPNLVIVDLGLPDISGESIINDIRKNNVESAIVVLTGRDAVSDVVQGLDIGADDYITKPFTAEELLARVRARLRQRGEKDSKLTVDDLELDTRTMEVKRAGELISLTPQEFKLLEYLMSNREHVLTREMILNRIWVYSPDVETRVVDVYIGYLRKKVDSKAKKKLIHSVRGFGYVLKDKAS